jgi:hypothetical protein
MYKEEEYLAHDSGCWRIQTGRGPLAVSQHNRVTEREPAVCRGGPMHRIALFDNNLL